MQSTLLKYQFIYHQSLVVLNIIAEMGLPSYKTYTSSQINIATNIIEGRELANYTTKSATNIINEEKGTTLLKYQFMNIIAEKRCYWMAQT